MAKSISATLSVNIDLVIKVVMVSAAGGVQPGRGQPLRCPQGSVPSDRPLGFARRNHNRLALYLSGRICRTREWLVCPVSPQERRLFQMQTLWIVVFVHAQQFSLIVPWQCVIWQCEREERLLEPHDIFMRVKWCCAALPLMGKTQPGLKSEPVSLQLLYLLL